jgi:hypothetical protein
MLRIIVPGAIAAILLSAAALAPAPAAAAPNGSLLGELKSGLPTDIVEVAQGRDRRYRSGHRYRRAPSHYRRYHRRPHDWYVRGCILVGPLWFCP